MQFVDPAFARAILRHFGAHGIAVGLVSPTANAMHKSIMDATAPLRDFLRTAAIHNFATQPQGEDHKRLLSAEYVFTDGLTPTKISLYRPHTKSGDPRIWFYRLKDYARPNDVLALISAGDKLLIVNASNNEILNSVSDPTTPLGSIASAARGSVSVRAAELLKKMRAVSAMGFVQSVRAGDTGVGATLESMLGIASNSRKEPDYFGIEIKASRHARRRLVARNRVNLFSQVPNWRHPFSQTAIEAVEKYGYPVDGRQQLYCTVDATKPNSQGLMLVLNTDADELQLIRIHNSVSTVVFVWDLAMLRNRLQEKHPESFWVKADTHVSGGVEYFRYHSAIHTSKPLLSNFGLAIADGTITLDLTMSIKGGGIRDHGYLFKIWPDDFNVLFPSPTTYRLC